jgi:hypothetical protein
VGYHCSELKGRNNGRPQGGSEEGGENEKAQNSRQESSEDATAKGSREESGLDQETKGGGSEGGGYPQAEAATERIRATDCHAVSATGAASPRDASGAGKRNHSAMIRNSGALKAFVLLLASGTVAAQTSGSEWKVPKPGIKEVQVPFASIRPSATIKVGGTADWVLITDDAVWVASTKPYAVLRIDPARNRIVASVKVSGEACSGFAFGFGSIWVPLCGKKPALVRIDAAKNTIIATLPITPAGPEGGITTSDDSVWLATDKNGTITRIDPSTNSVRQKISIAPGSYNPVFGDGIVWITGVEKSVVTAVDASSGKVLDSIPVGLKPRFLTAGGGSIWTLNQGDGTVSRVDEKSRKLVATIQAGIPGTGGDIGYGADAVWLTVFDIPLTRVDATTNKVAKQWVGEGGDSLRFGFDSLWITDYKKGLLSRIPIQELR